MTEARFDFWDTTLRAAKSSWMSGQLVQPAKVKNPLIEDCEPLEANLRLLALAGQFQNLAYRPGVIQHFSRRPAFPVLTKPLLPDALRSRCRRVLENNKDKTEQFAILRMLDRRQVMAHPFDWLPPISETPLLPACYLPLQNWKAGHDASNITIDETLDAETWVTFFPAERRNLLKIMRRSNPENTRELLIEKMPTEAAEERDRLMEILSISLSEQDIPYLCELAEKDRSGKVKTKAKNLLRRLGQGTQDKDQISGLEYLQVQKTGIFRNKISIGPKKKLNSAQINLLTQSLKNSVLSDLTEFLSVEEMDLIQNWAIVRDRTQISRTFVETVFETASDKACEALWIRMVQEVPDCLYFLEIHHLSRLAENALSAGVEILIDGVYGKRKISDEDLNLDSLHRTLLDLDLDRFIEPFSEKIYNSAQVRGLDKRLEDLGKDTNETNSEESLKLMITLDVLGLLLGADEAEKLRLRLCDKGILHPMDPRLDILTLNATLKGK